MCVGNQFRNLSLTISDLILDAENAHAKQKDKKPLKKQENFGTKEWYTHLTKSNIGILYLENKAKPPTSKGEERNDSRKKNTD